MFREPKTMVFLFMPSMKLSRFTFCPIFLLYIFSTGEVLMLLGGFVQLDMQLNQVFTTVSSQRIRIALRFQQVFQDG